MSRVALEGKTRLPNRLQEMVVDVGTMVGGVVRCTSVSGGGEPLAIVLRNFSGMDPLLENSINNLEKCRAMVEQMTVQNSTVDRYVAEVGFLHFQNNIVALSSAKCRTFYSKSNVRDTTPWHLQSPANKLKSIQKAKHKYVCFPCFP